MQLPQNRLLRHAIRFLPPIAVVVAAAVLLGPGFAGFSRDQAPDPNDSAPADTAFDQPFDPGAAPSSPVVLAAPAPEVQRAAAPAAPARHRERVPAASSISLDNLSDPLDCIIEPYEVVEIGSPVTGVIQTLRVERGDTVEAGQILAELESGVEKAAVALARVRAKMDGEVQSREVRFGLGDRRHERADELFERNALSLDEREQLETDRELARLELKQARENKRVAELELHQAVEALDRRTIRSPISGVVVERLMSPGEVVDEETILTIAQIDPLRVEVILPSGMFGTVARGTEAVVSPELQGEQVQLASVTIVDRVLDAASGTFGVRLELPNPDYATPGGLHCQVRFRGK